MSETKVNIIDLEGEVWKEITWIKGLSYPVYVSNKGRVKTGDRQFSRTGVGRKTCPSRLLKPQISTVGYWQVNLYLGTKMKTITVHRLVATAFLPNPENKRTINHIDSNKLNSNLENLEWATYSENSMHSVLSRPNANPTGIHAYRCRFTADDVLKIRELYATGNFKQTEIAKMYNCCPPLIFNIVKRKTYFDVD